VGTLAAPPHLNITAVALRRVQTQTFDGWLTLFILWCGGWSNIDGQTSGRSGLVAEAQALLKDAGKYRFSPPHLLEP